MVPDKTRLRLHGTAKAYYLNLNSYDLNIDIEIDRNQSQGNEHKEILVKFLQDQLTNNPELVNKLINTYQEDLKLWKSIT